MRRALLASLLFAAGCHAAPARPRLTLVTTTTTQDSGLLDRLVPAAEKGLGMSIRVIAVGSGEALAMAERGEADVVLCHSPAAEEQTVAKGDVVGRVPLMWNRFLVVGPTGDPAKVAGASGDPVEAFRRIREAKAVFVSRGDQSGTHKKEQAIWAAAGLYPDAAHVKQTGQGQGETLQIADQLGAYALADSSTWTRIAPRLPHLAALLDDGGHDAETISLVNPYHVMIENPEKHPAARSDAARALVEWLQGPEARAIITSGGLFSAGSPPGGG
jgi:tungstate transport system substrate-binding protein